MPELPDVAAYVSALQARIVGQKLNCVRIASPALLRTAQPPVSAAEGRTVREVRRIGKRIVIGLDNDVWLVVHLMIAGRLHWKPVPPKLAGKTNLAAFDFSNGSLTLTEQGSKRRASLHVIAGEEFLRALDAGGIDVFSAGLDSFRRALSTQNHTVKRALTDPHIIDGIGNAYSDEILHAAKISPLAMTQRLKPEEWKRLYDATQATLHLWISRLQEDANGSFPEHVTAFRTDMAVHGRFGKPCPVCGEKVLRIRYADNETNYCARCQTGGKVLADRALSRLLR